MPLTLHFTLPVMLKNYLKITLRTLRKSNVYSFINVFGLSIGMTCCLLILLYVKQELSYDTFYGKADRIYRIAVETTRPQGQSFCANTPFPLGPAFKDEYPEVDFLSRIFFTENVLVTHGENRFFEDGFAFADRDFFEIFSHTFLSGDEARFLSEPNTLILTASTAEKYFGHEDPIGQVIQFDNQIDFTVTAVIEDVPVNAHFRFNFLASYLSLNDEIVGFTTDQWGAYSSLYTYVLLSEQAPPDALELKAESFITRHAGEWPGITRRVFFQPITDIHLRSHLDDEIEANNDLSNLYIISTIGLFILLIASINFMNLSTARSSRRAREVGIRKALGAVRLQLVGQFLGESILLSVLALALSLAFVELSLPLFSSLVGKEIVFSLVGDPIVPVLLLGLAVVVGVFSGIYPALFLSGYRPATVLKGTNVSVKGSRGGLFLRQILVVSQFGLSIMLIIGTLIVGDQLHFLKNANMGFQKDYTLSIRIFEDSMSEQYETVKSELTAHPNVLHATACYKSPIGDYGLSTSAYPDGRENETSFSIQLNFMDFDYFDQFGLELAAGRSFSEFFPTDEQKAFIVNETLVRVLGYTSPEEVIGIVLPTGINKIDGTIIGVVKDYHIASLHEHIEPLVLMHWPDFFSEISVQIQPHDIPETLQFLETTWKRFSPDYPFQYTFLDEHITQLYAPEEQTSEIIGTFSLIAIFVACLGLFGLATFTAQQRTKEIGVRKVLGASVSGIMLLLSKDFLRLVLISFIVAVPVAYVVMNRWLEDFAYRIDISWRVFLPAGLSALLIALLTVSYQSVKAALSNPVQSLGHE